MQFKVFSVVRRVPLLGFLSSWGTELLVVGILGLFPMSSIRENVPLATTMLVRVRLFSLVSVPLRHLRCMLTWVFNCTVVDVFYVCGF